MAGPADSALLADFVHLALRAFACGIDLRIAQENLLALFVELRHAPALRVLLVCHRRVCAELFLLARARGGLLGLLLVFLRLVATLLQLLVLGHGALARRGRRARRARRDPQRLRVGLRRRLVGVDGLAVLVHVLVELRGGERRDGEHAGEQHESLHVSSLMSFTSPPGMRAARDPIAPIHWPASRNGWRPDVPSPRRPGGRRGGPPTP